MAIDELITLVDEMRAAGVNIGANTTMANYTTLADEIRRLRAALQAIIDTDATQGMEGYNEFFDGVSVAEAALKGIARKALKGGE